MHRLVVAMLILVIAGCGAPTEAPLPTPDLAIVPDIEARRAQFVPETVAADISHLSAGDREALRHLAVAAEAVGEIFAVQAWAGNPAFAPRVAALEGPGAEAARDYYRIMVGPWDRIDNHVPFIGEGPHPPGAGYYPEDMTAEEFNSWLEAHPEDREAFTSLHTLIRRDGDRLVAVPYSEAFAEPLERAAQAMRAAAAATDNASLKRFLDLRADAFLNDDYYASDMAWMDLDSAIEVVIGPYETYEDSLFGYKAAFECFLCVAQPEDSERLAIFKGELPFLEANLPIPDEHKNFDRGSESPIRVVDELLATGDTRAGVQTLAFNLPNDERVREAKGSKKVLLKNVMQAKYEGILVPIAEAVLPADEVDRVSFDAFFQFTLHHELSHGIGPGQITVDGRDTEVRLELKELYSAFEEAKADTLGVFNIYVLVDKGVMGPEILDSLPWTYTAGIFRTTRFGVAEAHGLGMVLQTNFLLEKGAVEITGDGRFRPVPDRFEAAFRDLAHELLMIQAEGDYDAAVEFAERYGTVDPAMVTAIEGLAGIPVDIDPVFPFADAQGNDE
ncbi:MAG TPA: peptidase [Methylomirabilota bacterium]|nr:peptidase [Methylomirabilota bacterium]